MKLKHYIYAICLIVAIMVGACLKSNGQTAYPGRVWLGAAPPATVPVSPNKFQTYDIWRDTVAKVSYRYKSGWYRSGDQMEGDTGPSGIPGTTGAQGPAGPVGPAGKDGVCPACPTNTSVNTSFLSVRWVNTWAEFKQAFADMDATSYPRVINLGQDISGAGDSIKVTSRAMMWELNGNNCQVSNSNTILYRDAANLKPESEAMIDMMPYIHNTKFVGAKKGNAIRLSSTYMGKIDKCQFWGFDIPLLLPRAMSMEISNNRFWNNNNWFVVLTFKGIPGGDGSTSQPNTSSIHDNCFRVDSLANGAILVEGGSLCLIYHNAIEGGTSYHNGSKYGIYLDYAGSPNVKNQLALLNHFEVKFSIEAVHSRQNDGNMFYALNYRQYGGGELGIDGDGGSPYVHYWFQDYTASNADVGITTQSTTGTGSIWDFKGLRYFTVNSVYVNEGSASFWKGGIVPYYMESHGYGEGQNNYSFDRYYGGYVMKGSVTINGKTY